MTKKRKALILAASLLLPQLAAVIGSFFTISAIPTWYAQLNKPFFNPPNWLFGPVWTLLYLMMGVALYLIWSAEPLPKKANSLSSQKKTALIWFAVQLVLNTLWSIIFFGLQAPALAFIEIIFLWIAIIITIQLFRRISKTAGWLLVPYLGWVSFAAILNLAIAILN